MATSNSPSATATAYEQYLRANWDRLTPYEQEEARAYLQSKFQYVQNGAVAHSAPGWTVPVGYVCCALALVILPIIFTPAGFGLGIYNASKGRTGHGVAQVILSIVCGLIGAILGVIVWTSTR
jgi:hypothetical protein